MRSTRRTFYVRAVHAGRTLAYLERVERKLLRLAGVGSNGNGELDVKGEVDANVVVDCLRALDIVWKRRRILLREPMPGTLRQPDPGWARGRLHSEPIDLVPESTPAP